MVSTIGKGDLASSSESEARQTATELLKDIFPSQKTFQEFVTFANSHQEETFTLEHYYKQTLAMGEVGNNAEAVQDNLDAALQAYLDWEAKHTNKHTRYVETCDSYEIAQIVKEVDLPIFEKLVYELKCRERALKASIADLNPHIVNNVEFETNGMVRLRVKEFTRIELAKGEPRRAIAMRADLAVLKERVWDTTSKCANKAALVNVLSEFGFDITDIGQLQTEQQVEQQLDKIRHHIKGQMFSIIEELDPILKASNGVSHATGVVCALNETVVTTLDNFLTATHKKLGYSPEQLNEEDNQSYRDVKIVVAPWADPKVSLVALNTREKPTDQIVAGIIATSGQEVNAVNNALSNEDPRLRYSFLYVSAEEQLRIGTNSAAGFYPMELTEKVVMPGKGVIVNPRSIYKYNPGAAKNTVYTAKHERERAKTRPYTNPQPIRTLNVKQLRALQGITTKFIPPQQVERLILENFKNKKEGDVSVKIIAPLITRTTLNNSEVVLQELDVSGSSLLTQEMDHIGVPASTIMTGLLRNATDICIKTGAATDRFNGDAVTTIHAAQNILGRTELAGLETKVAQLAPIQRTIVMQAALELSTHQAIRQMEVSASERDETYSIWEKGFSQAITDATTPLDNFRNYLTNEITSVDQYNSLRDSTVRAIVRQIGGTSRTISETDLERIFLFVLRGMELKGKPFNIRSYGIALEHLTLELQKVPARKNREFPTAVIEAVNLGGQQQELDMVSDAAKEGPTINKAAYDLLKQTKPEWAEMYEQSPRQGVYVLNLQKALKRQDIKEIVAELIK